MSRQIAKYESILADDHVSVKDKLRAMEQQEHLLGMGARFGVVNPRQQVSDMKKALNELDAQEIQDPVSGDGVQSGEDSVPL